MAFDENVGGWTSEFTFVSDSGLSLNNTFYTSNNGRMWRHNALDEDRNNFYGIQGNTTIEFVFNENPTNVKNYKSLNYEGSAGWDTTLETNLEKGTISSSHYIEKQGEQFAWIRGENNQYDPDLQSSNVSGVGVVQDSLSGTYTFNSIPPQLNVGDFVYRVLSNSENYTGAPALVGIVASKTATTVTTTTQGIIGNPSIVGVVPGDFVLYVKDNVVDKSGIIGYYNVVTMTNASVEEVDLFSVNANKHIMRS